MSSSCLITTQPVACVFSFLSSLRPSQFLGVMVSKKKKDLVSFLSPRAKWDFSKASNSEGSKRFVSGNS